MKKNTLKIWLLAVNICLFGLNFTPVLAQVIEVEVLAGGYRLLGPNVISFPNVAASFEMQESVLDIRDLSDQDEQAPSATTPLDYIVIEDQNGGNAFNVTVSAGNLTDSQTGNLIPNSNFFVRNKSGEGENIVANNSVSDLSSVNLHTDTNAYASLNIQRTLFTGVGAAPGSWRMFPVFKINVPPETAPGTYRSTLTFTVI